jgi:hypothetical protein
MPHPQKGENLSSFMHRFMGSSEAKSDFPKRKQRIAVGLSMARRAKKKAK